MMIVIRGNRCSHVYISGTVPCPHTNIMFIYVHIMLKCLYWSFNIDLQCVYIYIYIFASVSITFARYCCIRLPSPVTNMFQLQSTYCRFVNFSLIKTSQQGRWTGGFRPCSSTQTVSRWTDWKEIVDVPTAKWAPSPVINEVRTLIRSP